MTVAPLYASVAGEQFAFRQIRQAFRPTVRDADGKGPGGRMRVRKPALTPKRVRLFSRLEHGNVSARKRPSNRGMFDMPTQTGSFEAVAPSRGQRLFLLPISDSARNRAGKEVLVRKSEVFRGNVTISAIPGRMPGINAAGLSRSSKVCRRPRRPCPRMMYNMKR